MREERIDLYEYFGIKKPEGATGYLDTMILERYDYCPNRVRPAMLVVPGGGYHHVSQREAEPVALKFLEQGYSAFILTYSVTPVAFPYQLIEGCMAMAYIREKAKEFHIDPNLVGAVGFSAGGHLVGMLATMYNEKEVVDALKEKSALCRPDAVILSYPVISSDEKTMHAGSIYALSNGDKQIMERICLEKRVNANSSPAYIWTTVADPVVPMENSMVMASAYRKAGVPFELHVFTNGLHGLSIATNEVDTEVHDQQFDKDRRPLTYWVKGSIEWLRDRGFDIVV